MNILKDRKIILNKLSFTLTLLLNVLNSAMIFIHSKQRYTHYCQILFRISLQSLQTKESKPLSSIVTLGPVTSSRFRFIATYERGLEEGQGYSPDPETIPSCARVRVPWPRMARLAFDRVGDNTRTPHVHTWVIASRVWERVHTGRCMRT